MGFSDRAQRFTGSNYLDVDSPFACCIPGMVFGKSIQLKNKEYLRGQCLLPFSYSEIRLLFLINGIAIIFPVCSYSFMSVLMVDVHLVTSGKAF